MTKKNQREAQPATLHATTNYQAEYEEFRGVQRQAEYEKFRREFPSFGGGYDDYRQVMQMVQDEIRGGAEIAKIDQEQRDIKGYFLYPPICLISEGERQELLRLFADDAGQNQADEPRLPFLPNERGFIPEFEKMRRPGGEKETRPIEEFVPSDNYRRCRWRDRPEYRFNGSQAAMIKALHEDFLRGGTGLSDAKLFAATKLRRRQKRVEHVFRNVKNGAWVTHPAQTDGFLNHESGVWRLNLEKHEKHKD